MLTLEGGRTVEWEAVGAGPPLMWVEGGPGLWAHLARPDVALMSDLFCCHLVNAPGCGRTSAPADVTGYDLTSIIAFFEEVRERLGLGQVTVMGRPGSGGLGCGAPGIGWPARRDRRLSRRVRGFGFGRGPQRRRCRAGSGLRPARRRAVVRRRGTRTRRAGRREMGRGNLD